MLLLRKSGDGAKAVGVSGDSERKVEKLKHGAEDKYVECGNYDRKRRQLADSMESVRVDMLCVSETRWEWSKARKNRGAYNLFYHG